MFEFLAGSREIRDSASSEVLSAPTSPGENNQIGTHIGRNPLRGSKRKSLTKTALKSTILLSLVAYPYKYYVRAKLFQLNANIYLYYLLI